MKASPYGYFWATVTCLLYLAVAVFVVWGVIEHPGYAIPPILTCAIGAGIGRLIDTYWNWLEAATATPNLIVTFISVAICFGTGLYLGEPRWGLGLFIPCLLQLWPFAIAFLEAQRSRPRDAKPGWFTEMARDFDHDRETSRRLRAQKRQKSSEA